jgi:hypothetical protein
MEFSFTFGVTKTKKVKQVYGPLVTTTENGYDWTLKVDAEALGGQNKGLHHLIFVLLLNFFTIIFLSIFFISMRFRFML